MSYEICFSFCLNIMAQTTESGFAECYNIVKDAWTSKENAVKICTEN